MQISAALPTPIPGHVRTPNGPAQLADQLVTVVRDVRVVKDRLFGDDEVVTERRTDPGWARPSWRGGVAYVPGTEQVVADRVALANSTPENAIAPAGDTFKAAVRAAHRETMRATTYLGKPSFTATAVLQGSDGAFYIAPLGYVRGSAVRSITLDGPGSVGKIVDVQRHSEAVKAVVGGSTWVDFTGSGIDFEALTRA